MLPRALIVEDDPATREAFRSILKEEGFSVDAVASGELALELIGREHYAMVLLDIVLPKMSGAAVMEHLHIHAPAVLESVVVVTGLDVNEIQQLYPSVRAALGKPVLPAQLRKVLRQFLPGSDEATGFSIA